MFFVTDHISQIVPDTSSTKAANMVKTCVIKTNIPFLFPYTTLFRVCALINGYALFLFVVAIGHVLSHM